MPRVYVPHKQLGFDYSDASRFGEITFLLPDTHVSKFDFEQISGQCLGALQEAKADDLLMIAGLNSVCSIASAIIGRKFGHVNFLVFRRGKYFQRTVGLDCQDGPI